MIEYNEALSILEDKMLELNRIRKAAVEKWLDEVADPIFRETVSKGCGIIIVEHVPEDISWAMLLSVLFELGYENARMDRGDLIVDM